MWKLRSTETNVPNLFYLIQLAHATQNIYNMKWQHTRIIITFHPEYRTEKIVSLVSYSKDYEIMVRIINLMLRTIVSCTSQSLQPAISIMGFYSFYGIKRMKTHNTNSELQTVREELKFFSKESRQMIPTSWVDPVKGRSAGDWCQLSTCCTVHQE